MIRRGQGREEGVSDGLQADRPEFSEPSSFNRLLQHSREEWLLIGTLFLCPRSTCDD